MSIAAALTDNPVLNRELDERVSGRRAVVFIVAWLLAISAIFLLTFGVVRSGQSSILRSGSIGRQLFEWTLSAMLGLVLLIVPISTAGAIVNERERQTLAPLQISLLSPVAIVVAKLTASIAFVVLLTVISVPLLAACIVVGGVSLAVVIKGVLMVVFTAIVVGCIAIGASAVARRMVAAIVLTLFIVAVMVIGSGIALAAMAIVDEMRGTDSADPPLFPLVINPVAAVADVTTPPDTLDLSVDQLVSQSPSPLSAVRAGILELQRERARERFERPVPADAERTRLWRWYVVAMSATAVLCIGIASERVRAPASRER